METDIGNPIDYNPTLDPLVQDKDTITNDTTNIDQTQEYYYPDMTQYNSPPQYNQQSTEKNDFFSNVDKNTCIIAFAVFLLGFFMGKTMQPVILKYA